MPAIGRRAPLSREVIVDAAAALADAEGLESVTLARLADGLGVRSPSLFKHLDGSQDLQRELAILGFRTLSETIQRAVGSKRGDAAILAVARAYRSYAKRRPGLYAATFRIPDSTDPLWIAHGFELTRVLLRPLEDYGLSGDAGIHAARNLRCALHGFVALEAAGAYFFPVGIDESFEYTVDAVLHDLARGLRSGRAIAPGKRLHAGAGATPRRNRKRPGT